MKRSIVLFGMLLGTSAMASKERLDFLTYGIEAGPNERLEVCIDDECRVLEPSIELEKKGGKEQKQQPQSTIDKILDRVPILSRKRTCCC